MSELPNDIPERKQSLSNKKKQREPILQVNIFY